MMTWDMPVNLQGTGREEGAMEQAMTETEVARVADQWLRQESWETFPEVVLEHFPGRPDLIAHRQGICQVLECKRSFNLTVVEQAARWQLNERPEQHGMPHLVWVVVQRSRSRHSRLLHRFMREFGIGLVVIDKEPAMELRFDDQVEVRPQRYRLHRQLAPRIQPGARRMAERLIAQLNPDMRVATPGARGGETAYMTPFKRTMAMIHEFLQQEPHRERHISHIIDFLNRNGGHHYSSDASAQTSIPSQLDRLGYPRSRDWGCWFKGMPGTDDVDDVSCTPEESDVRRA